MTVPRVTALIVTFNSEDCIGAALESLRDLHSAGELDCIVIDNQSVDGTVELIRSEHPWVRVIAQQENVGYGRGLNRGLKETTTPYVLFMNPDARMQPGAIERLREFLDERSRVGMVAPAISSADGTHYQFAGALATPWEIVRGAFGKMISTRRTIEPNSAPFESNWLCGAVLLARRDLMVSLEGFDPRFFLYFEETDLCRRVTASGYELWAVGDALAVHDAGTSARASSEDLHANNCIARHYFQSRFYYLRKHFGFASAFAAELGELGVILLRQLRSFFRPRNGQPRPLAQRLRGPVFQSPPPVAESFSELDPSRTAPTPYAAAPRHAPDGPAAPESR